jgi:hypothetical protein
VCKSLSIIRGKREAMETCDILCVRCCAAFADNLTQLCIADAVDAAIQRLENLQLVSTPALSKTGG